MTIDLITARLQKETASASLLLTKDYVRIAKETALIALPLLRDYLAWAQKQKKVAMVPKIQAVITRLENNRLPSSKLWHPIMDSGYKLKVNPYLRQIGTFMFLAGLYPNFNFKPITV
jgi:hypothetical protein